MAYTLASFAVQAGKGQSERTPRSSGHHLPRSRELTADPNVLRYLV